MTEREPMVILDAEGGPCEARARHRDVPSTREGGLKFTLDDSNLRRLPVPIVLFLFRLSAGSVWARRDD